MDFRVREATTGDIPQIRPWTTDTFDWGDYVGESLADWLGQSRFFVMVCVLEDGTPAAISRAQLLSPTEGWLDAARVHPEHRRSGMGNAMNDAGVEWARERGARVVRLAVEKPNDAARRQVRKLGYRQASTWVHAERDIPRRTRLSRAERLEPASLSDLDAAWMFWSHSDLARCGRELYPDGWLWRRASTEDLSNAFHRQAFFQSAAGWVIAEPVDEVLSVSWMAMSKPDAPRILEAILDLAVEMDAPRVSLKVPAASWAIESVKRGGLDPREIVIYSKAVT